MNTLRPWQKNTPESLLGSTTCSAHTKTLIKLIIEYTEISVPAQSRSLWANQKHFYEIEEYVLANERRSKLVCVCIKRRKKSAGDGNTPIYKLSF